MLFCASIFLVVVVGVQQIVGQCPYKECTCLSTVIDCSNKNLTTFPVRQNPGTTYATLLLNGNKITAINGTNQFPVGLDRLDLSDNPLSILTSEALFGVAQTLKSIKFRGSKFVAVPPALEILDVLETLDIEANTLSLPDTTISKLSQSVESLRLANIGLVGWPTILSRFQFLRSLYLEGNPRIGNPPAGSFDIWKTSLTRLSLSNTGINSISAVSVLSKLQWLDVSRNVITDSVSLSYDLIPLGKSLQYLDASNNGLTIEPRLAELRALTEVHLSFNKISSVNTGAFANSITTIYLDNNQLTTIPNFIRDLPQVQFLNLQKNNIPSVSASDFPLNSRLTTVFLGENPITSIDTTAFDNFRNSLLYLNLESTKLTRLPLALKSLTRLQTLWVPNITTLVCTCDERALTAWLASVPYIKISGQCGSIDIKEFFTQLALQCP